NVIDLVNAVRDRRLQEFFFSSKRRHTRSYGDWSSDVCSSDLIVVDHAGPAVDGQQVAGVDLLQDAGQPGDGRDRQGAGQDGGVRSEERRGGKEWRYRAWG